MLCVIAFVILQSIIYKMKKRLLRVCRLKKINYSDGLEFQKKLENDVIENRDVGYLLLLEHPHTYTVGKRALGNAILADDETLKKIDASVFETNRGGKATYHGIGQLVGYPIISLSPDRKDVHKYVRDLEEVIIRTLADFDINGFRLEGLTGVHTSVGKVAAIGIHIKRWVTTHGFALNVNTDLSYFDWIIACEGEPVISMQEILDKSIELETVENSIVKHFAQVFGAKIEEGNI